MTIEIFGKNYAISDGLKTITEKKCVKFERFLGSDADVEIKFSVCHENNAYTTEMCLTNRKLTYRVSHTSQSPYDNVDAVIPKMMGQMRKQKDIWASGKKQTDISRFFDEE